MAVLRRPGIGRKSGRASRALGKAIAGRVSACGLLAAATITWQETWFAAWDGFVPRHLLLGTMFLPAFAFRDRLAGLLEYVAGAALLGYGCTAALGSPLGIGGVAVVRTYPACAIWGALATLAALGLAFCTGVFELVLVVRPQRSLRWYLVANVLVLVVSTLPAVR